MKLGGKKEMRTKLRNKFSLNKIFIYFYFCITFFLAGSFAMRYEFLHNWIDIGNMIVCLFFGIVNLLILYFGVENEI